MVNEGSAWQESHLHGLGRPGYSRRGVSTHLQTGNSLARSCTEFS